MACECIECCDGEHAGDCMECAGWGENDDETECSHCGGSGACPACHGNSANEQRKPAKGSRKDGR